ncbi:hypothetical protein VCHENC03_0790, partial [Vibrio sp. HENC-03]
MLFFNNKFINLIFITNVA